MKTMETFWASLETLLVEQHAREIKKDKRLCLVKIFLLKNDNFDLALRKRLFCTVKAAVLRCKTAAFGMQNNRCYNTLITRMLGKIYRLKNICTSFYLPTYPIAVPTALSISCQSV